MRYLVRLGLSGKIKLFQLDHLPYGSIISDANKRRGWEVFAGNYYDLLGKYHSQLSDSRIKDVIHKQVEMFDSTTISLFQEILKCTSRIPKNGKRKGGIKVLTVINVDEMIPKLVWFTSTATDDHILLEN